MSDWIGSRRTFFAWHGKLLNLHELPREQPKAAITTIVWLSCFPDIQAVAIRSVRVVRPPPQRAQTS